MFADRRPVEQAMTGSAPDKQVIVAGQFWVLSLVCVPSRPSFPFLTNLSFDLQEVEEKEKRLRE